MSIPTNTVSKQAKLALCIKAYVLSSEVCLTAQFQVYAAWATNADDLHASGAFMVMS
jgi:hypothetical protein